MGELPKKSTKSATVEQLQKQLGLAPHPEGGFYRETYRSARAITLADHNSSPRSLATAIYYLLTADTFSELHRLPYDELFHFYLGDRVELLCLYQGGASALIILGTDVVGGEQLQVVVPAGTMFGCRLAAGGEYALMGTTVAPGFDFVDYERGERRELTCAWPDRADLIAALTRQ